MVKEVEFSNSSEILSESQEYSNSADQGLFEGTLTDDGLSLNIKVRVPLLAEVFAKRKLFLHFCNVDFDNKLSEFISLGETDADFCNNGGTEFTDKIYTFDLSDVVKIPRKIYNTGGTSEITIESYTYEANLSTDYGIKTLSVPYTITSDKKYSYDKSTDGVYRLITADFEPWVDTRSYSIGDVVMSNDALLVSLVNDNSDLVTIEGSWEAADDSAILNYCTGNTLWPPLRAIVTDMMISRYAKYGIIKDILVTTGYKDHDDEEAYNLTLLLQNLREKAKFNLIAHKPMDALYSLQTLKVASSPATDTTKVYNYNVKYTT